MISTLSGLVSFLNLNYCVVEVGGVGFKVNITPKLSSTLVLGQKVSLSTSLIVREDSLTFYGFFDEDQREIFDILMKVSGVGPRISLAILASYDPDMIRYAVASGEDSIFTKVSGIGVKGARRIVLELADKLPPSSLSSVESVTSLEGAWRVQVVAALESLGWSGKEADAAIKGALDGFPEVAASGDVAMILKTTLKYLGRVSDGR